MIRSAVAVIIGYVVVALMIMVFFQLAFWRRELVPGPGILVLNAAFGFLGGIAGGYITGLIADRKAVAHGVALVGLAAAVSLLTAMASRDAGRGAFEAASVAGVAAGALLGAWIAGRGVERRRAAARERLKRLLGGGDGAGDAP